MPLQRKRSWMNWDGCEPIAAWQPLYAPCYQDTLWNWRNGYAAAGTDPSFAPATGWSFNGSTQYLTTGITPPNNGTVLLRFSGVTGFDKSLFGDIVGAWTMKPDYYGAVMYKQGNEIQVSPAMSNGILGMAAQQGYRNGVPDGAATTAPGALWPMFLGAANGYGSPSNLFGGAIQAAAFWDTTLTATQMWQRSQMLAHLENTDWSCWTPPRRWFFISPPPPAAATPVLSTIYINSADVGDTSLFDDVSGGTVSSTYARTGTNSFKLDGSDYLQADLTSSATKYSKFGLLVTDTPASDALLVAWQETGTEHVSLYLTDKLTLQMRQGSTIIQTSPTTLEVDTWYCIETKIVVHDTIGRFQVRIDGVDDMTAIGINTDDGVDGTINEIRFESPVDDTYIDDIVVREDQWCGIGGVYVVVPAASGTYSEWTGAYSSVGELPPSFTDYISAATTGGNESTFRHSRLTTDYSQIPVVGVFAKIRIDAAADVAANAAAYSNEEFAAGDAQDLDETGVYARLLMTINPDGSAVWTAATVDALEIGIKA